MRIQNQKIMHLSFELFNLFLLIFKNKGFRKKLKLKFLL